MGNRKFPHKACLDSDKLKVLMCYLLERKQERRKHKKEKKKERKKERKKTKDKKSKQERKKARGAFLHAAVSSFFVSVF